MTSKDRQRQLERERYERVQARMAEQRAAAKKRNLITAGVSAFAVVAVGVGIAIATSGNDKKATPTASSTPTAAASGTPTAASTPAAPVTPVCPAPTTVKNPGLNWPKEPAMAIDAKKTYTMTLKTNCGDIVINLDAAKAPHTVNSFSFLASQKFFDGSFCHRLSTSSGLQMLQCGDPTAAATPNATGDGAGGPGYTIPDENLTGATYKTGTVAMGNTGAANSGGSQFFLVFGDSQLGPSYTPFGTLTPASIDILKKVAGLGIANPGQDGTGRPNQPVEIESATVTAS